MCILLLFYFYHPFYPNTVQNPNKKYDELLKFSYSYILITLNNIGNRDIMRNCAPQVHIFLNLHVQIGWINWIFLFNLNFFVGSSQPLRFLIIWHHNLKINTINRQFLWCRLFHNSSLLASSDPVLCRHLNFCLECPHVIHYLCGGGGDVWRCLFWGSGSFLVSLGQ